MNNKVKVFNLNTHPLHEIFKGEEVKIEPQDYWRDKNGNIKIMDIFEANDYKGQYAPVPFDGSGKMLNDPRYFKMLKLEPVADGFDGEDNEPETVTFKCMAKDCNHISPSPEELTAHIKVRHPSVETLVLPEIDHVLKKKSKVKKEESKSA